MATFHFHLVDATTDTDLGSQDYEDAVQATEVADRLSKRLAIEETTLLGGGWAIVVTDKQGEVYRAEIEPAHLH